MLHGTQWLRFEVKDTGIGIDEKDQELIFEKYQQVDMNNTRSFDGKGLGLALCKSISDAMGGKISFRSQLGKGTSFFVELPCKLPLEQPRCSTELPFRLVTLDGPLRILIVDDNEVNKKMAQRMVERMGHTTYTAESGKLAVDLIREKEVDLVLMDVQMPVMDGIEATKYIRRRLKRSKRRLPVIGLTASFQHSVLKFYLNIGMNMCLGKPVRLDTLKRTIESVTSRCASGLYDDSSSSFGDDSSVTST